MHTCSSYHKFDSSSKKKRFYIPFFFEYITFMVCFSSFPAAHFFWSGGWGGGAPGNRKHPFLIFSLIYIQFFRPTSRQGMFLFMLSPGMAGQLTCAWTLFSCMHPSHWGTRLLHLGVVAPVYVQVCVLEQELKAGLQSMKRGKRTSLAVRAGQIKPQRVFLPYNFNMLLLFLAKLMFLSPVRVFLVFAKQN